MTVVQQSIVWNVWQIRRKRKIRKEAKPLCAHLWTARCFNLLCIRFTAESPQTHSPSVNGLPDEYMLIYKSVNALNSKIVIFTF